MKCSVSMPWNQSDLLQGVVDNLANQVTTGLLTASPWGSGPTAAQNAGRIKFAVDGGHNRQQRLLAHLHSHFEGSDGMGVDEVDASAFHQSFICVIKAWYSE